MAELVITGGRIVDQTGETTADVAIDDGHITEIGEGLSADTVLDANGCVVSPGFVDLHTHMREPGDEETETIATGSRAAALGGYTCVVAAADTDPIGDNVSVVELVQHRGEAAGLCDVRPSASITVGRDGKQLSPMAELVAAGVRVFADAGIGVQDPLLMRRALEYASDLGVVLAQHCEVARLTDGAVMHEGEWCSRLGLPGWPAIAEELMVFRDIELVRLTGSPVHLLHLSTARSVSMVRAAKADGLAVTADVTPHHISLTDERLARYGTEYKVNPPLRSADDVDALRTGLADGTIDAIATDHSPHSPETKDRPLDHAPAGTVGLETALGVSLAHLDMPLCDVVAALSWQPAAIAGVADEHGRPVAVGEPANLTVFDPDAEWQVEPNQLASLSNNTAFVDVPLRGRVTHTVLRGEPVVVEGVATK